MNNSDGVVIQYKILRLICYPTDRLEHEIKKKDQENGSSTKQISDFDKLKLTK